MARRPATKASRGGRAVRAPALPNPTPVPSTPATPLSSAYPSTYASEAEWDVEEAISKLPMDGLTLEQSGDGPAEGTPPKPPKKEMPFRFLDLPSEIRIKIYKLHFAGSAGSGNVIDLDPDNQKHMRKKFAIIRTCRTMYVEATHVFFSTYTFRLFPCVPGRFFKTKKPLLARLTRRQRSLITSLELRLGPGWGQPPRGWVVNPALGLADCVNVRRLTVYVECDPSDGIFNGWRRSDGFYEGFSCNLLTDVLREMPIVDRIYFDAYPGVKKSGAMIRRLVGTATEKGMRICWGPDRGWTDHDEEHEEVEAQALVEKSPNANLWSVAVVA